MAAFFGTGMMVAAFRQNRITAKDGEVLKIPLRTPAGQQKRKALCAVHRPVLLLSWGLPLPVRASPGGLGG